MKILIVTPVFPMPERGADQYERAGNIRQLKRLGHDVTVISKVAAHVDPAFAQAAAESLGVVLRTVPYRYSIVLPAIRRLFYHLGKLRNPLYLDGAAYEYAEPVIQKVLAEELERVQPDLVWFDYSYLWPLYHLVQKRKIPIITRSINFEPTHFLEEDGRSLINYVMYLPKLLSELITIRKSDAIVALSPYEAQVYRRLGASRVFVVPLRGLPALIRDSHPIRHPAPLHVFFMGSTYTVGHNERALDLVTGILAPRMQRECPGQFVFHVSGAKLPQRYMPRFDQTSLIMEGYVDTEKFDAYMERMDIALAPSPKKVGMQQKVYEPLCRGIPLIAPRVAVGGYPFEDGVHYMAAESEDAYVECLKLLIDPMLRAKLSSNSLRATKEIFSADAEDEALNSALQTVLSK